MLSALQASQPVMLLHEWIINTLGIVDCKRAWLWLQVHSW